MSIYDSFARMQQLFKGGSPTPGIYNSDKRVNFGLTMDTVKNLPKNPTAYKYTIDDANNALESARQTAINLTGAVAGKPGGIIAGAAAGAAVGSVVPVVGTVAGGILGGASGTAMYGIAELDKKTDGKVSKALNSGTKGVRSNYAFVRDVAKHDSALGFLALLGQFGGAVAGGFAAGAAVGAVAGGVGAIPGAIAGAAIGAWGAGKTERAIAETGAFDSINKSISKSAKLSQTAVGQERYNFGNDVVHTAAHISGFKTLGDTTKGIGAITAGIINFTAEIAVAPDVAATKLAGKAGRAALVGGITENTEGPLVKFIGKVTNEPARQAERLAKDVEVLKKTAQGEVTPYTPVFKFLRETDLATAQQRAEFRGNEFAQIGLPLVVGKSDEVISLVFRVGRGDKAAIDELALKHPATFAEMMRYEGVLEMIDQSGSQRIAYGFNRSNGSTIALSKKNLDNLEIIQNELNDLQGQYTHLNRMLRLDTALTERTVSRVPGVEALRNDIARQRAVNKLGMAASDLTERETLAGKIVQKVFTNNSLGVVIRKVERAMDDAPHQTVNFNDMATGSTRMRTTARAAVDRQLIAPIEANKLYDDFLGAMNETEKKFAIEKFETRLFEELGNKHGVPASIVQEVLKEYILITRKNQQKASIAAAKGEAYMIDDVGEAIGDPQLISQLANGHYLPDVELLDDAFARYAKKHGQEASLPVNMAIAGRAVIDEFQSVWRNLTLARVGFPINIMRDSTLRAWGDASLFYMMKDLANSTLTNITKMDNTVSDIKNWTKATTSPKHNAAFIRRQIDQHDSSLQAVQRSLKDAKYNPEDPKTITLEVQKVLDYQQRVQSLRDGLAAREKQIIEGKPEKVIGRDSISVFGYEFPAGGAGIQGKISYDKLKGKDDLRGLLASNRELEMANIRRDRTGGHAIVPDQFNEKLHLKSWETVLNNALVNDPIAKLIMQQKTEKEILDWIKSPASGDYVERFGYDSTLKRPLKHTDAEYIYNRVLNAVNQFAPNSKLWQPLLDGKLDITALRKLYPNWQERPTVITDLAEDLLGQSNFVRNMSNFLKDGVTWLATVPTSKLSYNPYFNVKYQHKLQNMVALANAQGRKLSEMDQARFESVARTWALNEFKGKINAFNRDMNYPAIVNYFMAFFPAVIEQYRAYGKIAVEHPEFPYKIAAMAQLPDQLGNVKIDEFGTEYVEVSLGLLGIKGRLPASWFNPVNPTGGHILSAGPLSAFGVNELAKKIPLPKYFVDTVLPFGVQSNAFGSLTPGQVRRAGQLFQAYVLKNGEQYNKDVNMFLEIKRKDFEDEYHRMPSAREVDRMYKQSRSDGLKLAVIRSLGAGILPAQPRYVTPLQVYSDLLAKYTTEYGNDGAEKFTQDYPEYYMLVDKLTDSTSGIRSDDTAVNLAKSNADVIERIVGTKPNYTLSALGAIFNDDDYNFSSTAQAWLTTNAVPGTKQKFKEQGAALANNTSSIVTNGWKKWNQMIEVVTSELINNDPPYDVATGYGKAVLDSYKSDFIKTMQTENNLWYEAKVGAGYQNQMNDVIAGITIAANTPKMWSQLAKQPRWHAVAEYMNFRYQVYDMLKARGVTIGTAKASDIRRLVDTKVAELRRSDVNFGKFYDRYFDGDEFTYVYEEPQYEGSK
jgi:hypothetical protein